MANDYDALVIGGGPAGAAAALLLARAGWQVVLLERAVFPRRKVCGEYLSATNLSLLSHLGIAECFHDAAGPEICQVGLFAGDTVTTARLPGSGGPAAGWGRALSRERLDTLLLREVVRAGVDVRQPFMARALIEDGDRYVCQASGLEDGATCSFRAGIILAAHGSWERGRLPTQLATVPARAGDLFGFKAHFHNSDLPIGLMPLLAFPGGYGGMVHCEDGRVGLSCCIRRDTLARIRRGKPEAAGEAVLSHILDSCSGVRRALAGATRDGAWLAAGPIRPGMRLRAPRGIFPLGNAAGEAHPVIAEGISMALQAAWLLTRRLFSWRRAGRDRARLDQVAQEYALAWRRAFLPRLHASQALALWAMRPAAVATVLPLVRCCPRLLTWGALWSGKATRVVSGQIP